MNSPATPVRPGLSAEERERLFAEMQRYLRRHVMDAWFPRCVDHEAGGFYSDFDRRWKLRGPQHRMLEFQARQARNAARLAVAFPREGQWAEIALHGWRYLRDQMWDQELGGWYWLIERSGKPLENGAKHAHSAAYAVEACIHIHAATGEAAALERAQEGFAWLDRHGHDDKYGGYQCWLNRDGSLITPSKDGQSEPLGHEIGIKDVNVHGDWIEALTNLMQVRPGKAVQDRLASLVRLYCTHLVTEDGGLHYGCYEDWRPQPAPIRYGYGLQGYYRLLAAAAHLPEPAQAQESALKLLRHILKRAWAGGQGGFWYAGPAGLPDDLQGVSLFVRKRVWWVQCEGLRSMMIALLRDGADVPQLREKTLQQWKFIRDGMSDPIFGGIYSTCPDDLNWRQRVKGAACIRGAMGKGGIWKDASHETDCVIDCMRVLSGQAIDATVPLATSTRVASSETAPMQP